jgi:hypothetical protein
MPAFLRSSWKDVGRAQPIASGPGAPRFGVTDARSGYHSAVPATFVRGPERPELRIFGHAALGARELLSAGSATPREPSQDDGATELIASDRTCNPRLVVPVLP